MFVSDLENINSLRLNHQGDRLDFSPTTHHGEKEEIILNEFQPQLESINSLKHLETCEGDHQFGRIIYSASSIQGSRILIDLK